MSAAKNCYDDAFMESWFGTLKTEMGDAGVRGQPEAVRELTGPLWYDNGDRRHSSLGYVSPMEFERQRAVPKSRNGLPAQPEAPHVS